MNIDAENVRDGLKVAGWAGITYWFTDAWRSKKMGALCNYVVNHLDDHGCIRYKGNYYDLTEKRHVGKLLRKNCFPLGPFTIINYFLKKKEVSEIAGEKLSGHLQGELRRCYEASKGDLKGFLKVMEEYPIEVESIDHEERPTIKIDVPTVHDERRDSLIPGRYYKFKGMTGRWVYQGSGLEENEHLFGKTGSQGLIMTEEKLEGGFREVGTNEDIFDIDKFEEGKQYEYWTGLNKKELEEVIFRGKSKTDAGFLFEQESGKVISQNPCYLSVCGIRPSDPWMS